MMIDRPNPFSDPQLVARYADSPPRIVPGFESMQRMTALLLAERVPADGRVLVIGAGGGLELKTFAQHYPGWTFVGVDPSAAMLQLARQTLGSLAPRVTLHQGYTANAPEGPFDGATCLLTLHFLHLEERRRTLAEIHRRLKPGAPLWWHTCALRRTMHARSGYRDIQHTPASIQTRPPSSIRN